VIVFTNASFAGDNLTLSNQEVFEGNVTQIKASRVVLKLKYKFRGVNYLNKATISIYLQELR